MENFITINNNIGECNHPMVYNDHMDYKFELAEDNYEEWLFAGGNWDDINLLDDNGYPRDGFYAKEKENTSFLSLDDEFPFD